MNALWYFGWLLYVAVCIALNWFNITIRGKKPIYFASNQWRIFFGLVFLILASAKDGFNGIDFAYPRTLIPYIPHAIYIVSSFYLFFDAGLNALRGKKWNYRGKSSGWLDRSSIVLYYVLKGIALIGVVVSSIILWR